MLEQIKSEYILKLIFSPLKPEIKLTLIKINKKIQDKLDINLIHYKLCSGKYFIGEKNGTGKEFDLYNDQCIFEGDYSYGKRAGYGKEYFYDKYDEKILVYEGNYLFGKRNGKGTEYYSSGKPSFKGIYVSGMKYIGEGYNTKGNIIYELKDGKGHIIELDFDGNDDKIFEGEYQYPNKKKGSEYYRYEEDEEIIFSGEYLNNLKWNGIGYDENGDKIYEIKNGKGFIDSDFGRGLYFKGEYLNGKRNGKGTEYNMIKRFEGEFLDGKRNGEGKEYFIKHLGWGYDDDVYFRDYEKILIFEGEYLYNSRIKGKEYYLNGKLEFEGEYFLNKKFNGKGYDENGNIIYELNHGNGKVKEYLDGDLIFEGEYLNGKIWKGKGKEFNSHGDMIFEGEYLNGKKWNGYAQIRERKKGRLGSTSGIEIRYEEGIKSVKRFYI